jgi:hypothetical protein
MFLLCSVGVVILAAIAGVTLVAVARLHRLDQFRN